MVVIKLSNETKAKLDLLKKHPRETYEDVLKELIRLYEGIPSYTITDKEEMEDGECIKT